MSDADRRFYQGEGADDPAAYAARMCAKAEAWLERAASVLRGRLPERADRLVEIGSGTCAMGVLVSRLLAVRHAVHTDISRGRLERFGGLCAERVGYRPERVEFVEMDMNGPFALADGWADVVLFDAALHHARNIWNCVGESFRVLRPGGVLLALREQMCPRLRPGRALARLLATREVAGGVSENCYLPEQYLYYLRAAGFQAEALPVVPPGAHPLHRLLRFLNGWTFASFVLLARRPEAKG